MIFSYDRKGLAEGPEVFLFQDILDNPTQLRELSRIFEPYFKTLTINLPHSIDWTHIHSLNYLSQQFKLEVLPLLQESNSLKIAILSGSSFFFWQKLLSKECNQFQAGAIFNPEWVGFPFWKIFQEMIQNPWKKPAFSIFDFVKLQPIAFQLSQIHFDPNLTVKFPLLQIRSKNISQELVKEKERWDSIAQNAEWIHFPGETWDSLKSSRGVKKLLLSRFGEIAKIKKDRIWSDILKT